MADDEEIICGRRYNAKCVLCVSTHTQTYLIPIEHVVMSSFSRIIHRAVESIY